LRNDSLVTITGRDVFLHAIDCRFKIGAAPIDSMSLGGVAPGFLSLATNSRLS
jgi:hypothetical protein